MLCSCLGLSPKVRDWIGIQFDDFNADAQVHCRYWNEAYFKALESIKGIAEKHNLTMAEIALRWVSHHSLLKREHGDAVLIGALSLNHIEQVSDTSTDLFERPESHLIYPEPHRFRKGSSSYVLGYFLVPIILNIKSSGRCRQSP